MAPNILVVAEVVDGAPTRLSLEIATLARECAAEAGGAAAGIVVAADPEPAAQALAAYLPVIHAVAAPATAAEVMAPHVAAAILARIQEGTTHVLLGATADGRDTAGALIAATGWGLLANASAITWAADGPEVQGVVLGGKAAVTSRFSGATGLITVAPGATAAHPAQVPGTVVSAIASAPPVTAPRVVDRVSEEGAAVALEDADVIVVGGRGVGGPEGFTLVEELAGLLGGVVAATRASVDSGWIPYARQIGQTGRTVKPALYLGLGVSGAMQHRVGMQGSSTIVVVNRDPDAPIRDISDLFVVGDLFDVGPALASELRTRGRT